MAAAWAALVLRDGAVEVARFEGLAYWLLALLWPMMLGLGWRSGDSSPRAPRAAAAAAGCVAGTLAYLLVGYLLPSVFAGEDAKELLTALREQVLWPPAITACAATALTALFLPSRSPSAAPPPG